MMEKFAKEVSANDVVSSCTRFCTFAAYCGHSVSVVRYAAHQLNLYKVAQKGEYALLTPFPSFGVPLTANDTQ